MEFIKALFRGNKRMSKEEYKMFLWEQEQLNNRLYSIEVAINNLKEEYNVTKGA